LRVGKCSAQRAADRFTGARRIAGAIAGDEQGKHDDEMMGARHRRESYLWRSRSVKL
jgi:hypothetical protein